jgi:DNA-binding transcriptional LysR family regulator
MDLRQLQSLVALSELGNLSSVGRQLHRSAAAIQKQLKSLSQEFQVRIYQKVGRRLELTEEAQLIIPYARAMLATHSAAAAALRQSRSQLRGMVHVGAGPAIATHLLPKVIRKFLAQYHHSGFSIETGSNSALISQLSGGQLEVVLSCGLPDDPNRLSTESSWDMELVFVLRATPRKVSHSSLEVSGGSLHSTPPPVEQELCSDPKLLSASRDPGNP